MPSEKSHFGMAFSFITLRARRQALNDFYIYCRLLDDVVDEEGLDTSQRVEILKKIENWVKQNERIEHPFWDRLLEARWRYGISDATLLGIIDGVRTDLSVGPLTFETWEELDQYVYGVSCCVGQGVLAILNICEDKTKAYSENMGSCVQYLNIMRDLSEDISRDRVYVPQSYLRSIGLHEGYKPGSGLLPIIREELYRRAMNFYERALPRSLRYFPADLMGTIYVRAATQYWRKGANRRLSKSEKLAASMRGTIQFLIRFMKASSREATPDPSN